MVRRWCAALRPAPPASPPDRVSAVDEPSRPEFSVGRRADRSEHSGGTPVLCCQLRSWKTTLSSRLWATPPYRGRQKSRAHVRNSLFLNREST